VSHFQAAQASNVHYFHIATPSALQAQELIMFQRKDFAAKYFSISFSLLAQITGTKKNLESN
jgi:hypothetical protein